MGDAAAQQGAEGRSRWAPPPELAIAATAIAALAVLRLAATTTPAWLHVALVLVGVAPLVVRNLALATEGALGALLRVVRRYYALKSEWRTLRATDRAERDDRREVA